MHCVRNCARLANCVGLWRARSCMFCDDEDAIVTSKQVSQLIAILLHAILRLNTHPIHTHTCITYLLDLDHRDP